jgi:ribosomal RNA-processing protein 17
LERHVKEVNDLLKPVEISLEGEGDSDGNEDEEEKTGEWTGIEDAEPEPIDHEAEYIDEDKYTTVTVEAMDVTKEGLMRFEEEELNGTEEEKSKTQNDEGAEDVEKSASKTEKKTTKRPWTKDNPKDTDKPRKPNSEQAKARKTG